MIFQDEKTGTVTFRDKLISCDSPALHYWKARRQMDIES